MNQKTIKTTIQFEGIGLHSGETTKVTLVPAPANSGICFVRVDQDHKPEVKAEIEFVREIQRRTALVHESAEVHTIEHLLSACHALGVTNLRVEMDAVEVPGFDGSALEFFHKIQETGLAEQEETYPVYELPETIFLEEGDASIEAKPCKEHLKLSYQLHYPHPLLQNQTFSVILEPENYLKEVAPARTFVLEREVEFLQKAGLGKGATTQNTLVIGEVGPLENQFRFEDECARHKMLDLIGDLSLLNGHLKAEIRANRSGHSLNQKLVLKLKELMECSLCPRES